MHQLSKPYKGINVQSNDQELLEVDNQSAGFESIQKIGREKRTEAEKFEYDNKNARGRMLESG
jgi:hypothetical protein